MAGYFDGTLEDHEAWGPWVPWYGVQDVCPLPDNCRHEVWFRGPPRVTCTSNAPQLWDWNHLGGIGDIVAYRRVIDITGHGPRHRPTVSMTVDELGGSYCGAYLGCSINHRLFMKLDFIRDTCV